MNEKSSICVLGLGYIGLPTASTFATHGHKVHGMDIKASIVASLQQGEIHIEEPGLATVVKAALASKNLTVGMKPVAANVYIIAVPTPSRKSKGGNPKADLSFVIADAKSIMPLLKKG